MVVVTVQYWDWTKGSTGSEAVRCDVCWQRQGHIHAANPLGDCTSTVCRLKRKHVCLITGIIPLFEVNKTQQEQETLSKQKTVTKQSIPNPRAECQSCHNGGVLPGQRRGINN